jgi:uncharacterized delta-60 repeat protein
MASRRGLSSAMAAAVAASLVLASPGAVAAAPGDLDTSFGTGGQVVTGFAAHSQTFATGVAVEPGGKIVAAGTTGLNFNSDQNFAAARYNPDGSLDPTFGGGGTVTTDIGTTTDEGRALAVQPDGKVVVAGISQSVSQIDDVVLVRYNADGSLDSTFGSGGVVRIVGSSTLAIEINAAAVQPDGKILVAGGVYSTIPHCCVGLDFLVARFNADGSLDGSFGAGGEARLPFPAGRTSDVQALALQPDGKVVVAGQSIPADNSTPADVAIARLNSDGSPDTSFGAAHTGEVLANRNDGQASGVAVQADGKLVVSAARNADFSVLRFNADGSPDTSFGTAGAVDTDLNAGSNDYPTSLLLQTDGKIIVAGYGFTSLNDFAVVRYNADGTLDTSFGSAGIAHTAFTPDGNNYGLAAAIQPDGDVVVAGQVLVESPLGNGFGLARFLAAPADANQDGIVDTLQPAGTPAGSFVDGSLSPATTGSIVATNGLTVSIADAPSPTDGVRITVGPGTGMAQFSVCGGFTLDVSAGSTADVTCGSVTVKVATGSADIVLGGGVTDVAIPQGGSAKVSSGGGGVFSVQNLGSTTVTVTIQGQQTTVAPGATPKQVTTWRFIGFSQPVDNPPVWNVLNAGQAVPLKWRMLDAAGTPLTTLTSATVTVSAVNCQTGGTQDQVEEFTTGASGLQNLGNGYYQFNWKTPKTYSKSCKAMHLDLGEGITHDALFNFVK